MNRREFVKKTTGITCAWKISSTDLTSRLKLKDFGIQLWSVRAEMGRDAKATLRALSSFGYRQIESFGDGNPENIFWKIKPQELKKYLDDLDLSLVSAHCDSDYTSNHGKQEEFARLADTAASVNMKYLINPYMIQINTIDGFKRTAEEFNRQGEICRRSGLRFGYHNHNYSFKAIDGLMPQSILMDNTDPNLVDFEMDIYWVVDAGEDPVEWLKKYPNRFRLCHIKDHYNDVTTSRLKRSEVAEEPELGLNVSCDLGKGKIDFSSILGKAQQSGTLYYFVEQERFDDSTPMLSAKINARYIQDNF